MSKTSPVKSHPDMGRTSLTNGAASAGGDEQKPPLQQPPQPPTNTIDSMGSAAGPAKLRIVADAPIKTEDKIKLEAVLAPSSPKANAQPNSSGSSISSAVNAARPAIPAVEETELLGSVTTLSSPAVRTSARVIQKLKLDQIRPASPPPHTTGTESARSGSQPKTPSHSKSAKVTWSSVERNLFFDAVCDYGKDFEAIANHVNVKVRRHAANHVGNVRSTASSVSSGGPDSIAASSSSGAGSKTKEHVRLLYYQTFHKVTKYLGFSDDIKKVAQELYALVNYGEMRKKLVFINHKAWAKLTELVYQGTVMVRVKGKNIRIKTPACKALRRLNQMEEWQEEIKLPAKVEVFLRPANGEAWNRVQTMAMNPRVKTTVPLQKRLVSLLRTMQQRWRSREARLSDQTLAMLAERRLVAETPTSTASVSTGSTATATATTTATSTSGVHHTHAKNPHANHHLLEPETAQHYVQSEPRLRFSPPPNTVIHRPMVNLAEFLSSYSICLNAYEERIGVTVKGETLAVERLNTMAKEGLLRSNAKRQRNDSGCGNTSGNAPEKKSPEYKRARSDPELMQAPATTIVGNGGALTAASTPTHVPSSDSQMFDGGMDGLAAIIESSADESDCKEDVLKNTFQLFGSELEQLCSTAAAAKSIGGRTNSALTADSEPVVTKAEDAAPTTMAAPATTVDKAAAAAENRAKRKDAKTLATRRRRENFRPLISEAMVARIMRGWCETDIGDVTVGDLYIMFGQEFKLSLEYAWQTPRRKPAEITAVAVPSTSSLSSTTSDAGAISETDNTTAAKPPTDSDDDAAAAAASDRIAVGTALSNKLKQLLLLASLAEKAKEVKETKVKKVVAPQPAQPNCTCGHYCDKNGGGNGGSGGRSKGADGSTRSYISNKTYPSSLNDNGLFRHPLPTLPGATAASSLPGANIASCSSSAGVAGVSNNSSSGSSGATGSFASGSGIGRFGATPLESYRMNLSQARNKQNRWLRARNMRTTSKQVVVQRLLPLQPGAAQTYDVIRAPDGVGQLNSAAFKHSGLAVQKPLSPIIGSLSPRAGPSSGGRAATSYHHRVAQGLRQPRKIVLPERNGVDGAAMLVQLPQVTEVNGSSSSERAADVPPTNAPPTPTGGSCSGISGVTAMDTDADDDDSIANDPGIQSLMDISLPSPTPSLSNLDDLFSYSNVPPMSPMSMLRQSPTDPRWFEDNVNDFSLSSFLGQLDAAGGAGAATTAAMTTSMAAERRTTHEDGTIETPRKEPLLGILSGGGGGNRSSSSIKLPPLESSRMSSISEASIDYMSKFEEIAQSMLKQQQQQQQQQPTE